MVAQWEQWLVVVAQGEAVPSCAQATTVPRESEAKWNYRTLQALASAQPSQSAQSFQTVHALRLMIADDWPVKVSQ